jgi:NAD(P)-dependent dehydrogenase (short-subunit alcohol dehydrogenase family)
MDIAIVTGAESALGIRIVERLVRQGCRVYGLGNNFSQTTYTHKDFIASAVDITDLKATRDAIEKIIAESGGVHVLVHALDVAPATDFERLGVGNLEALMTIGLMTPVVLTRLLLPNLLQVRGQLLFALSTNKEGASANATAGLMEAGLRRFASELLLRHRDAGLRVSTVLLRHNTAPGNTHAADGSVQTRIHPDHAAEAIERMLAEGDPNILGELTLYPRASPAALPQPAVPLPIDPYQQIQLPPKHKRPEEPDPIATRKPERPKPVFTISDAELEDRIAEAIEDYERDAPDEFYQPQRDRNRPANQPSPQREKPKPSAPAADSPEVASADQGEGERKSKRSRGRSRRQRERARREREQQQQGGSASPSTGGEQRPAESNQHNKTQGANSQSAPQNPKPASPQPERRVSGQEKSAKPAPKQDKPQTGAAADSQKTSPAKKVAKKKTARKTATKKAATKTVKRVAKKKTVKSNPSQAPASSD